MKSLYLLALLCLMAAPAWATHLLGGQIQAQNLSGTTYSIRVILYMDATTPQTASDLNAISVCPGDGNVITVPRQLRSLGTGNPMSINIYQFTHTYSGPGTYRIATLIPNRTATANLVQATDQLFTVSTTVLATSNLRNSTPSFDITYEFWEVATNQRARLPFRAADNEGDSLVYLLTRPLTAPSSISCSSAAPVSGYRFPNAVSQRGTYKLNARTGELVWDAPTQSGQYTATVLIQEWRSGILISESYVETFIRVQDKAGTPATIPPYEPAAETSLVLANEPESDNGLSLNISPNPVNHQFTARLRSPKATTARLQLLDLSGRVVAEKFLMRPETEHESLFVTESLPSGMYVVKADVGGKVVSRKVVKQ